MITAITEIMFLPGAINESMLGDDLFDQYDEAFGPKSAQGWIPVGDIPADELGFSTCGDPLEILLREEEDWYTDELVDAHEELTGRSAVNLSLVNFHKDFSVSELEFLHLSSPDLLMGELAGTQILDYRAPSRVHWNKITRDLRQGPRGSGESHVPGKVRYRRETIRHMQ